MGSPIHYRYNEETGQYEMVPDPGGSPDYRGEGPFPSLTVNPDTLEYEHPTEEEYENTPDVLKTGTLEDVQNWKLGAGERERQERIRQRVKYNAQRRGFIFGNYKGLQDPPTTYRKKLLGV